MLGLSLSAKLIPVIKNLKFTYTSLKVFYMDNVGRKFVKLAETNDVSCILHEFDYAILLDMIL